MLKGECERCGGQFFIYWHQAHERYYCWNCWSCVQPEPELTPQQKEAERALRWQKRKRNEH